MEPVTTVVGSVCLAGGATVVVWKKLQRPRNEIPISETGNPSPVPPPSEITYGFSRGDTHKPKDILLKTIRGAERSLDIAVYTFTDMDIASEIIKAHRHGIAVRLITDFQQWKQHKNQKRVVSKFISEGIVVKMNRNAEAYMHLKVTVVDEKTVTTGSFNYSKLATSKHEEVLLQIHDARLAQDWRRHFDYMWEDESRYELFVDSELKSYA